MKLSHRKPARRQWTRAQLSAMSNEELEQLIESTPTTDVLFVVIRVLLNRL